MRIIASIIKFETLMCWCWRTSILLIRLPRLYFILNALHIVHDSSTITIDLIASFKCSFGLCMIYLFMAGFTFMTPWMMCAVVVNSWRPEKTSSVVGRTQCGFCEILLSLLYWKFREINLFGAKLNYNVIQSFSRKNIEGGERFLFFHTVSH